VAVAEKALTELKDISSQVRAAALLDGEGKLLASTLPDEQAERLASAAKLLFEQAEVVRGEGEAKLTQLEAATPEGSVFLVREGDHVLAATTGPQPTAGLVFYDLRAAARATAEKPKPKSKPKQRRAPAKKTTTKAKTKAKADEST
jgi:predicted regulator of Ras-like GTPase activity (Roadblock/LC7/MglB family)